MSPSMSLLHLGSANSATPDGSSVGDPIRLALPISIASVCQKKCSVWLVFNPEHWLCEPQIQSQPLDFSGACNPDANTCLLKLNMSFFCLLRLFWTESFPCGAPQVQFDTHTPLAPLPLAKPTCKGFPRTTFHFHSAQTTPGWNVTSALLIYTDGLAGPVHTASQPAKSYSIKVHQTNRWQWHELKARNNSGI